MRGGKERGSFSGMAALVPRPFTLAAQPTPERLMGAEVSPGYFALLGVQSPDSRP